MIRSKLLMTCLIAGTLLGACQTKPQAGSAVQRLPLPAPAATQTQEVEWGILSPGEQPSETVVTLSLPMFDRLVANEAEQLRWIKEAVEQLRYYRGEQAGATLQK